MEQYDPFRETLLATDRPLHHTLASEYWGLGQNCCGKNRFGQLLMKLRESMKSSWPAPTKNVRLYINNTNQNQYSLHLILCVYQVIIASQGEEVTAPANQIEEVPAFDVLFVLYCQKSSTGAVTVKYCWIIYL